MLCTRRPLRVGAALLAAFATAGSLAAQVTQAHYPLITDTVDATANYGQITLDGNPPPAPPNNGVCVNGIYLFNPNGQDVRTPEITSLDSNDFQLELEFQVAALASPQRPILIGGNGWRWIGFSVRDDGTFGILYNNSLREWSSTTLQTGIWYKGMIKFEAGDVELWLDGVVVHTATIGALNTGPPDLCFTTNNFSNGTNHNGCIRELKISNDTTLGAGGTIGTNFECSSTVPNSTTLPGTLIAEGSETVANNDVTLTASQLPLNVFGYFLNSPLMNSAGFIPPGSQGRLCIGPGSIGRYNLPNEIYNTGSAGEGVLVLDLTNTPIPTPPFTTSIQPGETWYFTSWYRDNNPNSTSNFTDAVCITFN